MEFERSIVAVVEEAYGKEGISHSAFARLAFGPSDIVKWRKIRNQSKHGKPQRLLASDVALLASALGKRPSELIFLAEQRISLNQEL